MPVTGGALPRRLANCFERAIYRRVSGGPESGRWTRLLFPVLETLYRRVAQRSDPLVRMPVAGLPLWMPYSHLLPVILRHYPRYGANLVRLAALVNAREPDLAIIDVGANIGDTVALLRAQTNAPVLCVEGDPFYFHLLQENLKGVSGVAFAPALLGAPGQSGWATRREQGTASLVRGKGGGPALEPLDALLERHPSFTGARLLKTDTDGFDGFVLRGAERYLRRVHPVLFIEYAPDLLAAKGDSAASLREFLAAQGYQNVLAFDNFGDLLVTLDLRDTDRWQELDAFVARGAGSRYLDLGVFHAADRPLFEAARASELAGPARRADA